jgi:ammonia channel protein AmtB
VSSTLLPALLGGLVGAGITQLFTSFREARRRNDERRTFQRNAVAGLLGALSAYITDTSAMVRSVQSGSQAQQHFLQRYGDVSVSLITAHTAAQLTVTDVAVNEKVTAVAHAYRALSDVLSAPWSQGSLTQTIPFFQSLEESGEALRTIAIQRLAPH